MGPLLLTKDVPMVFDAEKQAAPTSWMQDQGGGMKDAKKPEVQIPVAGIKGYVNHPISTWLQVQYM